MKLTIIILIMLLSMTGQADSRYKIAVIDSGFNSLSLFTNNVPLCREGHFNFITNRNDLGYDVEGHGTAVTNLIDVNAGSKNRKKRCFLVYKIFRGRYTTDQMIAGAIIKATKSGARVMNLSLGGIGFSFMVSKALEYASRNGVRIYVAAGNEGLNLNHSCTVFPACNKIKNMYVIGALNNRYIRARYSNYGIKVDIWERGSAYGMRGTSFASPRALGKYLKGIGR